MKRFVSIFLCVMVFISGYAFAAPSKTPKETADLIQTALNNALDTEDILCSYVDSDEKFYVFYTSPDALNAAYSTLDSKDKRVKKDWDSYKALMYAAYSTERTLLDGYGFEDKAACFVACTHSKDGSFFPYYILEEDEARKCIVELDLYTSDTEPIIID